MKKVGLLGGTFDPIHNGHLHAARVARDRYNLDDVLFIPAKLSPMKQDRLPHSSAGDRLAMVQLAIGDEFSVLDLELKREGLSYTIDTVRTLLNETKEEVCYHLILGEDALSHFSHWKEAPSLLELAPPIVIAREGFPKGEGILEGMTYLTVPTVDISSTNIRSDLESGIYDKDLVPPKVLDYIKAHRLYLPPNGR